MKFVRANVVILGFSKLITLPSLVGMFSDNIRGFLNYLMHYYLMLRNSIVAQHVKDLALSLPWLRLLLQHRFNPWPRNVHMLQGSPKRKENDAER